MTPRTACFVALALLGWAACGDDDAATGDARATTTTAAGTAAAPLPDACDLVPDAAGVSGLTLGEPAPAGDERRRVCAYSGTPGLTVAVEGGDRFEEKAQRSEEALGDPGEEITGLGDRARFFFSDADIPEGVGGMLVEVGDRTLEVTLQGLDEDAMRDAATALAEVATANLHS
jgi:hypothetical protein